MKKIILFLLILFVSYPIIAEDGTFIGPIANNPSETAEGENSAEEPKFIDPSKTFSSKTAADTKHVVSPKEKEIIETSKEIKSNMKNDLDYFISQVVNSVNKKGLFLNGYIPIEAHVAKFFMTALSGVARGVFKVVKPFLNILIITLFAFWIMIEAWNLIKDGGSPLEVGYNLVVRGLIITLWMWILNSNPMEIFSFIMMPIISIGTSISDFILKNAVEFMGTNLPDTCKEIHSWLDNDTNILLSGKYAADLICLPTKISGFFYSSIVSGFQMIAVGIFVSPLSVVSGIIMVIIFLANLWKFFQIVLGVIIDLFFVLLFLPFTAFYECFKGLQYEGFGSQIWKELTGFVKEVSFSSQIMKFINAAIHFVVLSVIASLIIAMLSGINYLGGIDIITVVITGFVANYLLDQVDTIAKDLGGSIDSSSGFAIGNALKEKSKQLKDKVKEFRDALTGKAKSTAAGNTWSNSARTGAASPSPGGSSSAPSGSGRSSSGSWPSRP